MINNSILIGDIRTFAFKDKSEMLEYIADKKKILIAINAEKIMKNNPKLKKIINENIGYSDGSGAVMALKKKGLDTVKIAGAEFWLEIIQKFYKEKSFYLMGASEDVIEHTILKLKKEYSNINIVGYRDGFLNEENKKNLIIELKDKKPDIVFVAQGSPRQEFLMDELLKQHEALYMGLGGSFDVYTGLKKRAPNFFIKLNLEWLYRLLKEPTRIGRQLVLIKFLFLLSLGKL